MDNELTKADKIDIIDQHMRNIEYSRYNLELSRLEENALTNPDQAVLDSVTAQMADMDAKLAALTSQRDILTA
jgi:hypothetical protein